MAFMKDNIPAASATGAGRVSHDGRAGVGDGVRTEMFSKVNRTAVLFGLICLAGFAARLAYRISLGNEDFWTNGYSYIYDVAKSIVDGNYSFAGKPPLYPYFLTPAVLAGRNYVFAVVPQALFGVGTVLCAYFIGKRFFGARTGLIALFLTAFYPYYVVHDTALQETGMMTLASSLSVYLLLRANATSLPSASLSAWLAAGVMLALAALVHGAMLLFAFLAPIWLLFFGLGPFARRAWRAAVVFLAFALVTGAWLVRADLVTGRAEYSGSDGYRFWVAHNPQTFSHYPQESIDVSAEAALNALSPADKQQYEALSANPIALDDWLFDRGRAYVRANPGATAMGALKKLAAGFSVRLNPVRGGFVQTAYLLSYAPVLLLGLAGMMLTISRWRELGLVYMKFISFIIGASVFWAHTSHRVYLDVFLIIFAANSLDRAIFNFSCPRGLWRQWAIRNRYRRLHPSDPNGAR
jgi:4-amino-4-deoxy-L-arabinose transferase-like glycosyltransferase